MTGSLGLLRTVALIAMLAGAGGSAGLFFRAGRSTPRFLLVIMAIWVFSPFVALLWANIVSKGWSVMTRATLYGVTLAVVLGSLAVYGADAVWPRKSQPAFVFVAVPPASWVLIAVVPLAAFISGRLSRRHP
jgi:hypothetical protein